MGQQRLAPDVILAITELTGVVGDIQDDPDSPDGNWLEASGNNVDTDVRTSFGTPTDTPTVGADLQEFRILVRQYNELQTGTPKVRMELWENGSLIRAGSDQDVPAPGPVLSFTWNANELGTADGSLVECKVVGTKSGGGPTARNSVEVGAVEWNCEAAVIHNGAGQSDGTSTATADGVADYAGAAQSDGTSTATGTAVCDYAGQGQSDGLSTATGTGGLDLLGAAQSDGTSTATGTGTTGTIHEGAGQSDGTSTATGTGSIDLNGATQSDGTSTATGTGVMDYGGQAQSDGTSTATATATMNVRYEYYSVTDLQAVEKSKQGVDDSSMTNKNLTEGTFDEDAETLFLFFQGILSGADETILDGIVAALPALDTMVTKICYTSPDGSKWHLSVTDVPAMQIDPV